MLFFSLLSVLKNETGQLVWIIVSLRGDAFKNQMEILHVLLRKCYSELYWVLCVWNK